MQRNGDSSGTGISSRAITPVLSAALAGLCVVGLAWAPSHAAVTVLKDRDFVGADWQVTQPPPPTITITTVTGGQPGTGTARRISVALSSPATRITELSDTLVFVPPQDGPVAAVGAALVADIYFGVVGSEFPVGLAIEQSGTVHYAFLGNVTTTWTQLEVLDVVPLLPGVDWSAGAAPIRFGYYFDAPATGVVVSHSVDFDNLEITIDAPGELRVDDLVVTDSADRRIIALDPDSGRESVLTGCAPWASGVGGGELAPNLGSYQCDLQIGSGYDITYFQKRKIDLEPGGFILARQSDSLIGPAVVRIDVRTGNMTVVTDAAINPPGSDPFVFPQDVTGGEDGSIYLSTNNEVTRVDPSTGARTVVSPYGGCPVSYGWEILDWLAPDRIAAVDLNLRTVATIDTATGACDPVLTNPAWIVEIRTAGATPDGDLLLGFRATSTEYGLRRVDMQTGATTVLAAPTGVGSGEPFGGLVQGVAELSDGRIAYVGPDPRPGGQRAVVLIDPTTLVRTRIEGTELMDEPFDIVPVTTKTATVGVPVVPALGPLGALALAAGVAWAGYRVRRETAHRVSSAPQPNR